MNNQQNPTQIEEKRLCKKCGQRLPSKSGFCMYCGTDNSITSVQHELEKQNNEQLKKYKVIESQKHKPLWYLIFLLLLIDIIVISTIMIFNTNNMYVKVNTARFQDYEEALKQCEEALKLKDVEQVEEAFEEAEEVHEKGRTLHGKSLGHDLH